MSLLNLPMKTMGGKVFWNIVREKGGWKLQQNMFTGHYRILDPNNIRRGWETEYASISLMFDAFTSM